MQRAGSMKRIIKEIRYIIYSFIYDVFDWFGGQFAVRFEQIDCPKCGQRRDGHAAFIPGLSNTCSFCSDQEVYIIPRTKLKNMRIIWFLAGLFLAMCVKGCIETLKTS
jgi:hypothetical protein